MKKLLTLLNEYEKKRVEAVNAKGLPFNIKLSFRPYTERDLTNEAYRSCWLEICSKYYGFIKWLVENEKIDIEKVKDNSELYIKFSCNDSEMGAFSKIILMLLSIQDNPISFLISVLK